MQFVKSHYTPYELCKLVNELTGRNLPPQMFYNYTRPNKSGNALIKSTRVDGKIRITASDAKAWFERYCRRNEVVVLSK